MSRFDGSVTEVFLHSEHVNPGLRNRETNGYIFARDLAVFATDVARYEDIGSQFDFGSGDAERGPHLQRQFAILGWTYSEPQQFDVASIRRLESA